MSVAFAGPASAVLVFQGGLSEMGLGSFAGSMTFVATSSTTGELSVELTNTSPVANSGWLTAFAFNVVDGVTLALATPGSGWNLLVDASGSPYGTFDYGASTSVTWEGGGPPSNGIAVGATMTTVFSVTASASVLATLTDSSFFDGSGGTAFIARFRGFADGNSDKVTGVAVPAPGALALLGLAGLAGTRRRR
jgi:MYXO-CTERM domain-containing protein